eukprot:TRINITY_DN6191_c0_g1_i1.p1 TRINITY_DN6191_c0_g1~~TRINITY_DN6191_c0_g1_i1.p1  ORF type:complete len:192 (+),score=17.93 TRINITY_DN6191_c0_g1_i1:232-807(+)
MAGSLIPVISIAILIIAVPIVTYADLDSRLHCRAQSDLLYNVSHRLAINYQLPYTPLPGEGLAEAICCDSLYSYFAEPEWFFNRSDVSLFDRLNASAVTTFYDTACGIPLFRAPVNRTFQEWKSESLTHGWPSFRTPEILDKGINVTSTGEVLSSCGTHLGTIDPDEKGQRYCLDLVCLSGQPNTTASQFT